MLRPAEGQLAERATLLEILGADVRLGPGSSSVGAALNLAEVDLVVASPGWRPTHEVFVEAERHDVPVWSEVELAWRLRGDNPAPWLVVTGTNGKTTTVGMLESILVAAGRRAIAVGNVGTPIVEAVMDPDGYDALAVELSSFQLHWPTTFSAEAAVVLNVAPDHLDWHGGLENYADAKSRVYHDAQRAAVFNAGDERTLRMVEDADVVEGCRAIGFTLGIPAVSELGVVEDFLVDRAFVENRATSAAELCAIGDLGGADAGAVGPHVIANALAAAALARAHGVPPVAVRDGLRSFSIGPHRFAHVATIEDVAYVDDSKATNPHAAQAALQGTEHAVWIAGGLAKGAGFEGLIEATRERLRAVVLIGADRDVIAQALQRHAPDVARVEVDPDGPLTTEADSEVFMARVVEIAAALASPGDTVVLAPGCASMDQFRDYHQRGEAFVKAVHRLADRS
jgi:UDP-N-acetylmuramoylalanine--D-glutamate ligase